MLKQVSKPAPIPRGRSEALLTSQKTLTYSESIHKRNLLRKLRVWPEVRIFLGIGKCQCYPVGVKVPIGLSLTTKVKVLNR